MIEPRLGSAMLIDAIRRLVDQEGGFATVISKGDGTSGAIILQVLERGDFRALLERMPQIVGGLAWVEIDVAESPGSYLERRMRRDPDVSIIELDVPDATRFILRLPTGS